MAKEHRDKTKWNERYSSSEGNIADSPIPADASLQLNSSLVLVQNVHLLPESGSALDLACGLGDNALQLARYGLKTSAWDISDVAIDKVNEKSEAMSLAVETQVRDVVKNPPLKNSFDVIVVSRFLDRSIIQSLIDALKPAGLIFYQTFVSDKQQGAGPTNPDYLLKQNELLNFFQDLTIRVYREEGMEGDTKKGFRNEALLVAQKVTL